MKKCSRFLALLLVVMMLPVFGISAEEASNEPLVEIELLKELDVVSAIDAEKDANAKVSRAEYAEVLVKLLKAESLAYSYFEKNYSYDVSSEYYESGYINAAIMMGLLQTSEEGIFGPTDGVTYIEAIKGMVKVLGYDTVAKDGSDAAFIMAAQRAGILKGVNKPEDGFLTRALMYRLIANSLDTKIIGAAGMGENDSVLYEKGDTLLAEYHDIYEVEGKVCATKYGAIDGNLVTSGSKIIIADEEFITVGTKFTELLGYNVKGYYKLSGETRELILLLPFRNETLQITTEKIADYSKRTYTYYDENDKKETVSTLGAIVFYNGMSAEGTVFPSIPSQGQVIFIDNDRDGKYDVVSIWDYTDYIVAATDRENEKIYVKYDTALNFEDYDEVLVLDNETGAEKKFSEIAADDVITVLSDANGKKATIYVCRTDVTGMVDKLTEDDTFYVHVNEKEYKYSRLYAKLLAEKKMSAIEVGGNYKLRLNRFGRIVSVEALGNYMSDFSFGIAVASNKAKGIGGDYSIKIFTQLGIYETFKIAENCDVDDVNYKKPEDAHKQLCKNGENGDLGESFVAQALRFKINDKNEITDIDLVGEKNDSKKGLYLFHDATSKSVKYLSAYTALAVTSTNPAIALNKTIMIKAPIKNGQIDGSDHELFGSDGISNYSNSANIKGLLYKTDPSQIELEFFVTAITLDELTGKELAEIDDEATVNLFLESYRGLNSEGEEVTMIKYSPDGTVKTAALDPNVNLDAVSVSNDTTTTHKLDKGDIFRFKKNSKDEIVKIEAGYDYSEGKFLGTNYVYAGQSPDINVIWRPSEPMYMSRIYVEQYQDGFIKALYKDPGTWDGSFDDMILIKASRNSVLNKAIIYDGEKNEVKLASSYALRDYKSVGAECSYGLFYRRYGDPRKLIFFK